MSINSSKPASSAQVKAFVAVVVVAGLAAVATSIWPVQHADLIRFGSFLVLGAVASTCKMKLPGHDGSMSVNLPYILLSVALLPAAQAMAVAAAAVIAQSFWTSRSRVKALQLVFNLAMMMCAVRVAAMVYARGLHADSAVNLVGHVLVAGVVYFAANTVLTAAVMSLAAGQSLVKVWAEIFGLTFPYYVLGTTMAAAGTVMSQYAGWQLPLAALPVLYAVYRSYRVYFGAAARENAMSAAAR
jgi:hypothetical protein